MADKDGKFSTGEIVEQLGREVVERITKRAKTKNKFVGTRMRRANRAGTSQRDNQSTDSNNR